jgi:hypothetical protein
VVTFSIVRFETNPIIQSISPSTFVMPRFRKSKLPADIPDSTPTPPAELVRNLTPQRDSRALAASSTAVAGSAFCDTRDTSSDGAAVRGRDTGCQMAQITDYRVRATGPTVIFAEHPARFQYNKECTIERGTSTMTPRTSVAIPKTSAMIPGTF